MFCRLKIDINSKNNRWKRGCVQANKVNGLDTIYCKGSPLIANCYNPGSHVAGRTLPYLLSLIFATGDYQRWVNMVNKHSTRTNALIFTYILKETKGRVMSRW